MDIHKTICCSLKRVQKAVLFLSILMLLLPAIGSCILLEDKLPRLSDANTGPYLTTLDNLDDVKSLIEEKDPVYVTAFQRLVARADLHLEKPLYSVTYKADRLQESHHGFNIGGRNDYVSLSTYAWPDPEKGEGHPWIIRDGQTNPEYRLFDRESLGQLSRAVEELSLAWYFTGDSTYSGKAAELVRTWFLDEETRMNPHMKHAQFWPGVNKGGLQGIIEARDFIPIIEGVSLLYDSPSWSPEEHRQLKYWFYEFMQWIRKTYAPNAFAESNVGTWLDVQKTIYALFTEQNRLLESRDYLLPMDERISLQISREGKQSSELSRMSGLYYSWFNLKAYVYLNEMHTRFQIKRAGTRSESGKEASLLAYSTHSSADAPSPSHAFDWLFPYASGQRNWKEDGYYQVSEFSPCRFIEIYRPAALSLGRHDYESLVQELLADPACLNINILLTHPPLE